VFDIIDARCNHEVLQNISYKIKEYIAHASVSTKSPSIKIVGYVGIYGG